MEDKKPNELFSELELESVKKLPDVKAFTSLSEDTLKREYAEYIVDLSPRRRGMKFRHVLQIASGKARAPPTK